VLHNKLLVGCRPHSRRPYKSLPGPLLGRPDYNEIPRSSAREDIQGKLDTLKHISTLDGATVVALLLVQRAWELDQRLVATTLGTVGVSFLLAILGFMGVSSWLGSSDAQLRHYTFGRYYWITFLSTCVLLVGVFLFLFAVFMGPEP
jgi:hypothetical protein